MDYGLILKHINAGLVSSPDDNWWTGVLWCFYSDGTHSLPLLRHISTNLMKTHSWEWVYFHFWVNNSCKHCEDRIITGLKMITHSDYDDEWSQTCFSRFTETCRDCWRTYLRSEWSHFKVLLSEEKPWKGKPFDINTIEHCEKNQHYK